MTPPKVLSLGCDYARFAFPAEFESQYLDSFFMGLSDNSNFSRKVCFLGEMFDSVFVSTRQKNIVMFQLNGVPLICIEKCFNSGSLSSSYFVIFYGSYFLFDLDLLDNFILMFGSACIVSRCDIFLDVATSVQYIAGNGRYVSSFSKFNVFGNGDDLETVYIGNKSNNNKRWFIRIYNKILDSKKKEKSALYSDYFKEKNVTRIEVQFGIEGCRMFGIKPVCFYNLKNSFCSALLNITCKNKSNTYLYALEGIDLEHGILQTVVKRCATSMPAKMQTPEVFRFPYVRRFIGYARNLKKLGYDPVDLLSKVEL